MFGIVINLKGQPCPICGNSTESYCSTEDGNVEEEGWCCRNCDTGYEYSYGLSHRWIGEQNWYWSYDTIIDVRAEIIHEIDVAEQEVYDAQKE